MPRATLSSVWYCTALVVDINVLFGPSLLLWLAPILMFLHSNCCAYYYLYSPIGGWLVSASQRIVFSACFCHFCLPLKLLALMLGGLKLYMIIWEWVAVCTYLLNYLKRGGRWPFESCACGVISIPRTSYSLNFIQARGMAAIISLNLATLTNTVFKQVLNAIVWLLKILGVGNWIVHTMKINVYKYNKPLFTLPNLLMTVQLTETSRRCC